MILPPQNSFSLSFYVADHLLSPFLTNFAINVVSRPQLLPQIAESTKKMNNIIFQPHLTYVELPNKPKLLVYRKELAKAFIWHLQNTVN
jgi:hypothetical protein